ncbi:hypothetical protein ADIAL_0092 [Alkalibacterium sp. AK22]|uniref:hypothetical protein n=1 Tax=Alkalibacterium sp. AK22 TaxID=1229520 RepID=UPI00044CFBBD|nr:hypothetical protein [Alkalibacterium sp. AK22]EXJ24353.1 hypothetical protein ADIAL_0092 [Alkalibacterium sp. AK22]
MEADKINKFKTTLILPKLIIFGFLVVNIYVFATTTSNLALFLASLSFIGFSVLLLALIFKKPKKPAG